jgi:hypothetical protein
VDEKQKNERTRVKLGIGYDSKAFGSFSADVELEGKLGKKPEIPDAVALRGKSPEERGYRDGLNFLPFHETRNPRSLIESEAATERDIATSCESVQAAILRYTERLKGICEPILRKIENFPQKVSGKFIAQKLQQEYDLIKGQIDGPIKRNFEELERSKRELKTEEQNYNAFRKELASIGINRDANLISFQKKLQSAVLLFVVWFVEVIFNGLIFARGVEGGPLEGVLTAAAFSLLNVGGGIMLGYISVRRALYNNKWQKISLFIVCLSSFLFILLNFLIAHAREDLVSVMSGNQEEHRGMSDILWHMLSNPFDFGDASGLALLIVGLAALVYSVYKGYSAFDDTIPHYAEKFEKVSTLRSTIRTYEANIHAHREGGLYKPLADALLEARSRISNLFDNERKKLDGMRAINAKITADIRTTSQSVNDWVNSCIAAVQAYRAENRSARRAALEKKKRKTFCERIRSFFFSFDKSSQIAIYEELAKPPIYFEEPVKFDKAEVLEFHGMEEIIDEAEQVVSLYNDEESIALSKIDQLVSQLSDTFARPDGPMEIQ